MKFEQITAIAALAHANDIIRLGLRRPGNGVRLVERRLSLAPASFRMRNPPSAWFAVSSADVTSLPTLTFEVILPEGAATYDRFAGIELDGRRADAAIVPIDEVAGAGRELAGGACIHTHRSIGPQNEQLTRLTLPSTFGPMSRQTASVLLQRAHELAVG